MTAQEFLKILVSCSKDGVFRAYDALIRLTGCEEEEFKLYMQPEYVIDGEPLQEFYFYENKVYQLDWCCKVAPFINYFINLKKPEFSATEVFILVEARKNFLDIR